MFVTGQREVHQLCRALRGKFPGEGGGGRGLAGGGRDDSVTWSHSDMDFCEVDEGEGPGAGSEEEVGVGSEEEEDEEEDVMSLDSQLPLRVLPLYSLLSPAQQARVSTCVHRYTGLSLTLSLSLPSPGV